MKAIINRMRYDTDKAEEIAQWSNHFNQGDFHWQTETLYVTKSGNLFLHGEGGALSQYQVQVCGGSSHGEKIIPMKESDAINWLESRGMTEALEKYFPKVIMDA